MAKKANYNTKLKRFMERLGYSTTMVESWNSWAGVKQDFDGYLDAISLNPDGEPCTLGIQCTGWNNISSRWHKITNILYKDPKTGETDVNPRPAKAKWWLRCGNGIWIVGFKSDSLREWEVKIRRVFLDKDGEFVYEDEKVTVVGGIEKF
jgi:hypothetical protein